MDAVKFVIPGDPVGKGRPRFVRATGHTYTPERTKNYEDLIRLRYPGGMFPGDAHIRLCVDAYFGIPRSKPKKERKKMLTGEIRPAKKPDADNIVKSIMDGLNGTAYADDAQVVEVTCRKFYSENPRVEIYLSDIKAELSSKKEKGGEK